MESSNVMDLIWIVSVLQFSLEDIQNKSDWKKKKRTSSQQQSVQMISID